MTSGTSNGSASGRVLAVPTPHSGSALSNFLSERDRLSNIASALSTTQVTARAAQIIAANPKVSLRGAVRLARTILASPPSVAAGFQGAVSRPPIPPAATAASPASTSASSASGDRAALVDRAARIQAELPGTSFWAAYEEAQSQAAVERLAASTVDPAVQARIAAVSRAQKMQSSTPGMSFSEARRVVAADEARAAVKSATAARAANLGRSA